MKPSRYNLFVPDDSRVYAVNLLSRAALDLSAEAYATYRRWADEGAIRAENVEHTRFAETLRRYLFLLEDDFDERAYIDRSVAQGRFSGEQLGIVVAPTMGCNFACHYCFEDKRDGVMEAGVQSKLVDLVRTRLPAYDELAVQWFGGEPLRALSAIESLSRHFLALAAECNARYAATVITNGVFYTQDVSQRLADLGVRHVQVTFDGDRHLHDRTRREQGTTGSFDRIVKNIVDAPSEVDIVARIHLAPFNYASVLRLLDELSSAGVERHLSYVYFAPLFNYHVGMKVPAYHSDGKRFATSSEFAALEIDAIEVAHARGFRTKDPLDAPYSVCTALRSDTIVVDPEGRLSKCYKDVGVEAEAFGDLTKGVTTPGNHELWVEERIDRDDECQQCQFLPVCLGGCAKQWHEEAEKKVICTPLKFNYEDRLRLYFRGQTRSTSS
jgi:uncharacterized protein